ncbi:hypothetical protein CDL15_Pgr011426 [Punica granatum]|uniref:Serine/threonine-protein phosphatase 6 regulatory subunit 3 n=1 Tax=Punica granatum TaxID=22663 RepID=A0A218WFN9_PUNGR|nr:hypothetical protein CDL15_Pgr011426 [Punica granatum]
MVEGLIGVWETLMAQRRYNVETILDKENFTLEELLDEDEIIQECKALNGRLINFLREKPQVEQLVRYIVEEAPEDADTRRTLKFPFISCEIFTCEVDIILKTLVEDEELMNLLFSFVNPKRSHGTLLAGYFSKVLIRLFGVDEHMYANYMEAMRWIEDSDVLEMIVSKFSSSDCPEVHSNSAETLCAIARFAPPGLAAKVSSPSFIERLFLHALEDSRPKSVLVNLLSVCISLLDPKRLPAGAYMYSRQLTPASTVTALPGTVDGMLQKLGDLLKLLEFSSSESVLPTTYGKLQPPLGKHRLKIVEFVSVLLTVGGEAAEKELINLGAVQRILCLFFDYPYNNFLHHHVDNILLSCLESKNASLIEHLLRDCALVGKILEAEKNCSLAANPDKPTLPAEGRQPPRIGNIGHLTRVSNKVIQMGSSNNEIQAYLQENNEWNDWQANVLSKRNAVENVYQWTCGRPTALQDRTRDSDDDDYQDRDYDVAALANNLSQAFRYGIYSNEDVDEAHGSLERDDEDVYFDDESAEVVISSLRLGDDHEGESLFTNSNWFAFEDDKAANEQQLAGSQTQPSSSPVSNPDPSTGGEDGGNPVDAEASLSVPDTRKEGPPEEETGGQSETEKPVEWIEWRENSDFVNQVDAAEQSPTKVPNGEVEVAPGHDSHDQEPNAPESGPSPSTTESPSVPDDGSAVSGSSAVSEPLDEGKPGPGPVADSEVGKVAEKSTDEEDAHQEDKKDEEKATAAVAAAAAN